MHKLNEKGELLLPLIVVALLLVGSLGFGTWAFMGRQEYKNNVDEKIAEAVIVAEENLTIKKDAEFAESYKQPYSVYKGPSALGTLTISYPKTWSNYVDNSNSGGISLDGIMHPGYIPGNTDTVNYALRYQVVEQEYEDELRRFDGSIKQGKLSASAYRLPNLESILGVRVEGELDAKKQGVMILLPLRDKTVKIWTEGNEFRADFDAILSKATFIP